jgi:nicotinamide-nucleotide amidase
VRVGICSVGSEIISGEITDSNATWLAQRLGEIGAEVGWVVAVGDVEVEISEAVRWLADRCDAVIVGGGLGPTPDDRTRAALSDVAGAPLLLHDDLVDAIRARFDEYGVTMPPSNARQAEIPDGAVAYPPVGTAPGFRVSVTRADGATCDVFALPGVPWELKEMTIRDVLPDLELRSDRRSHVTRTVHVTGAGESRIAEILEPLTTRTEGENDLEISFLASSDEIRVRVTAGGTTPDEARARSGTVVKEIVDRLGTLATGLDDERVEETIGRLLRLAGMTVATAESCTAGLIASRLASVTGATDYLRGGLVAYATGVKHDVLGVDASIIEEHGPCAVPTAEAMAVRAREVFGADIGVGIVCVAGPTPQGDREVGTTIWALATPDGLRSWSRLLPGDRAAVTTRAAAVAIESLRRHLLEILEER